MARSLPPTPIEDAVLVTGGAGYVGAHACEALSAADYRPIVLDDLSTGRRDFVRWGPLVIGDVSNAEAVRRMLVAHRIGAVLHFAASSVVPESVGAPLAYYRNNVGGLLGLLEGMRLAGVDRLVFSSTCAVYGEASAAPIRETHPLAPITPYGRSKLTCEQILADASAAHGLNVVVLRYFNASGASPCGWIGEDRPVETHLIPRAVLAHQGRLADFAIHGADYDTPDGTAIRDYVHVCDLAEGHRLALAQLAAGRRGFGVYNLGSGSGRSVRQVLQAVARQAKQPPIAAMGVRRPGDPACLVADPSRARRELGFRADVSDLETIVADAWTWAWHSRLSAVRASGGAATPSAFPAAGLRISAAPACDAPAPRPSVHGPARPDADGGRADEQWG